ncbi:MAG: hypothetical protein K2X82_06680, partial [Gemmataceae bacterium]|nr:hypothetical protein [Gemmataceae bacterium]
RLLAGGVTARGRAGGFEVAGLTGIGFGLAAAPGAWPFRARLAGNAEQVALAVREENRTDTQVRADLLVLAGLMAAERGAVDRAADRFREALRLGASDEVGGAGFAAEPVARAYLNWIAAARAK